MTTKMTNKFSYKLGQGGYVSVYKGWLSDGTPVAVKLMEKSYNDGEEFCNEVAAIGRIHMSMWFAFLASVLNGLEGL